MRARKAALIFSLLYTISLPVYANPEGGVVTAGSADITEAGKKLDVHQHTDRAVIDWRSFNVEVDEHTQFHQPGSGSVAINRVNNADPSHILGKLTANGNVVLINPNGVFFGQNSVVDVNGIVATSADIDNDRFMDGGELHFDKAGHADAKIVNSGTITAKDAGLVGLVAPVVENHGVIVAKAGRVHLASGDTATVDFYGDGLMEVAVSNEAKTQAVINTGSIEAQGGTIALTAAAGKDIVDSLIVASGELKAPALEQKNGKIVIFAEGSNAVKGNKAEDKGQKTGHSTVIADAYIDVSGRGAGQTGGKIKILGDKIALAPGAVIDASGDAGGGDIQIGGDYLGTGDTATAERVHVDQQTLIANDAITEGDGGRTIVWSDDTTDFHGNIFARGGEEGGDGGFVETSGKQNLKADGHVDLTARHESGNKGTYLLDPANITIYGDFDPTFVSTDNSINLPTNLALWLDADDPSQITLTYSTTGTTAGGAIGTNTVTTAANVSAYLQAGARIRLGASGAVTTADTVGADTYTIASIVGTTITTVESLTSTYAGSTLNKGLVSTWGDKGTVASDAAQASAARMPLYIASESSYGGSGAVRFYRNLVNYMDLTPDLNNAAGGYNSIFYTMNWGGGSGMPFGFTTYDTWFNSGGFGINNGAGNVYGVSDAPFLNTSHQISLDFFNGVITGNELFIDSAEQTETFQRGGAGSAKNVTDAMRLSSWLNSTGYTLNYVISEMIILNKQASVTERNLIEQYQAVKSDITLVPPGTGIGEAAQAMASDGYGAFTTSYLERLSATADISLQATNDITLDLQGATMTLDNDRSLTLATTSGNITTASAGDIIANRTGTGGNITMTSGGAGNIDLHHVNLFANNSGVITLNAGGGLVYHANYVPPPIDNVISGSSDLPSTVVQASQTSLWDDVQNGNNDKADGNFEIIDEPFYDTFSDAGYFLTIAPELKKKIGLK